MILTQHEFAKCDSCETIIPIFEINQEKKNILLKDANSLLEDNLFDDAQLVFSEILSIDNNDTNAHWGLLLCEYGVELESVTAYKTLSSKKILSSTNTKKEIVKTAIKCHKIVMENIFHNKNCVNTFNTISDLTLRESYFNEVNNIAKIQQELINVALAQPSVDIIICYNNWDKITDNISTNIYKKLKELGLRLFCMHKDLNITQESEPYVYSAINSAKIMLVIGSTKEYFNEVSVKNEWGRFLKITQNDVKKRIIPCCVNMASLNLPDELLSLKSYSLNDEIEIQNIVKIISDYLIENTQKEPQVNDYLSQPQMTEFIPKSDVTQTVNEPEITNYFNQPQTNEFIPKSNVNDQKSDTVNEYLSQPKTDEFIPKTSATEFVQEPKITEFFTQPQTDEFLNSNINSKQTTDKKGMTLQEQSEFELLLKDYKANKSFTIDLDFFEKYLSEFKKFVNYQECHVSFENIKQDYIKCFEDMLNSKYINATYKGFFGLIDSGFKENEFDNDVDNSDYSSMSDMEDIKNDFFRIYKDALKFTTEINQNNEQLLGVTKQYLFEFALLLEEKYYQKYPRTIIEIYDKIGGYEDAKDRVQKIKKDIPNYKSVEEKYADKVVKNSEIYSMILGVFTCYLLYKGYNQFKDKLDIAVCIIAVIISAGFPTYLGNTVTHKSTIPSGIINGLIGVFIAWVSNVFLLELINRVMIK